MQPAGEIRIDGSFHPLLSLSDFVPDAFTSVGSELLFEVISRRYEDDATLVTSNL